MWLDERGPWQDLVGVFSRHGPPPAAARIAEPVSIDPATIISSDEAEERIQGQLEYLQVLDDLHQSLVPRTYLEIGVRFGRSLALARGLAVGVDPAPEIKLELPATTRIFDMTSDDFFGENAQSAFVENVDFAFIDGLHLFEAALRDFMNIERLASPEAIVAIDDVLPNHPAQAARQRSTRVWTGDVWRLVPILRCWRPDLVLALLDTSPTGLLLIGGLNPTNRVLWENYNPIVREALALGDPPPPVLTRAEAITLPSAPYDVLRTELSVASGSSARKQALSRFISAAKAGDVAG
jgi:predicted O-methyltransferase YrrM